MEQELITPISPPTTARDMPSVVHGLSSSGYIETRLHSGCSMAKGSQVANISSTACLYHVNSSFARLLSQRNGNGCHLTSGWCGWTSRPSERVGEATRALHLHLPLAWTSLTGSGCWAGAIPYRAPILPRQLPSPSKSLRRRGSPHSAPRVEALAKLEILALFPPSPTTHELPVSRVDLDPTACYFSTRSLQFTVRRASFLLQLF
jgi:hypothetical protein